MRAKRDGWRIDKPLPFHDIHPRFGGIEDEVDEMIIQKVYLVDIENTPVRPCQKTRLKGPRPLRHGGAEIEAAHQHVLRGIEGQSDETGTAVCY